MAYSQADLDALDAAVKTGALRVEFPGGGSTTYRTLAEMNTIRGKMVSDIQAAAGTQRVRRVKIYATKDL